MEFLVLGTLYVVGLWPNHGFDVSNLTSHGGFFPHGVGAIFSSIVIVALLIRSMDALRYFDIIWQVTGGGPANATKIIPLRL